jgi:hypothetical protein
MNPTVITYLVYLTISITLTVWVARTLSRNGKPFLDDAFNKDEALAKSVNQLLVVGFYLINFGYVALNLKLRNEIIDARQSIEALSVQVGLVLLVLGGMHFFNLYIFNRIRRRNHEHSVPPPVAPNERLAAMQGGYCGTDEGIAQKPA